jgi:hypothetical protein
MALLGLAGNSANQVLAGGRTPRPAAGHHQRTLDADFRQPRAFGRRARIPGTAFADVPQSTRSAWQSAFRPRLFRRRRGLAKPVRRVAAAFQRVLLAAPRVRLGARAASVSPRSERSHHCCLRPAVEPYPAPHPRRCGSEPSSSPSPPPCGGLSPQASPRDAIQSRRR